MIRALARACVGVVDRLHAAGHGLQATSQAPRRHYALVPMVLEQVPGGERAMDIWSMLLQKRIVYLQGEINDDMANAIVAQFIYLEAVDPEQPIHLYINSPGGSVNAGNAIFDTMNYVSPPVETLVLGQAASMASLLLSAGAKGKRCALPHSRVMLHQPMGGASGQVSDVQIRAEELRRVKRELLQIYQDTTGQSYEHLEQKLDRDFFLTAHEAQKFGIVDRILRTRKSVTAQPPGSEEGQTSQAESGQV